MAEPLILAVSEEAYDKAVHGGLDELPVLSSGDVMAVYFKQNGTEAGRPVGVVTFAVKLPDGTMARAQYATTLRLFEMIGTAIAGWKKAGVL